MQKYPVLIIIPHGGYAVPLELTEVTNISDLDLFIQSDTCANDIFAFEEHVTAKIDSTISRLCVDLDRNKKEISDTLPDGVIKNATMNGKPIFSKKCFPDNIAIKNILNRYYNPFHETIKKMLLTGDIKFVLECHTMMSVGPRFALDAGKPRPIVLLENNIEKNGEIVNSCDDITTISLLDILKKQFADEPHTITQPVILGKYPTSGYLINSYLTKNIPYLKISISKSLFLNDDYFSFEYLKVDEIRIQQIKEKLWKGLEKFFKKFFSS